ncbi:protein translocase subunit SecF [Georgenia halophila]|uniref:Protein-export membrane protein SecF n=1 Tax=Georgenia halophila TaxID=620889 RepID=A0ABP8LQV2_9MICO
MFSFRRWGNELYTGRRSYDVVGRRKTWFTVAAALIVASIVVLLTRGINAGIEFEGGSQFTISGAATTNEQPAYDVIAEAGGEPPRVSTVGDDGIRVQTGDLSDAQTREIRTALAEAYDVPVADVAASFIGPSWGQDVTVQALISLGVFLVLISVILIVYFRTWTMAVGALGALLHDVIVTAGVYAAVGFEVTPASVIGLLTILGYSLYDTVVVFDKVRENNAHLFTQDRRSYAEGANLAVNQTMVRSINTSVTGLLPVGSILFVGSYLLGAGTLRDIALALFVGMLVSTLSSVFLAAPIEVALRERKDSVAKHTRTVMERRERRRAAVEGGEGDPSASTGDLTGMSVVAGRHLGHTAQPRRKKGRR